MRACKVELILFRYLFQAYKFSNLQVKCDGAHKSANNHKIILDTLRYVRYPDYVVEEISTWQTNRWKWSKRGKQASRY